MDSQNQSKGKVFEEEEKEEEKEEVKGVEFDMFGERFIYEKEFGSFEVLKDYKIYNPSFNYKK